MKVGIKVGLAAAGAIVLGGLGAGSASASFPGGNGHIYISAHDPNFTGADIYRVRPDGTGLKKLTTGLGGRPDEGADPSIAANGKRLAFTTGSQAASDVWVMNGDGTSPDQLTFPISDPNCQIQGLDQMPGISPNGERIAFMTTRQATCGGNYDYNIWTMDADGTTAAALLDSTGEDYHPEFAPGGQSVVMSSEVTGDLDIASVPVAGAPHTAATAITGASDLAETTPTVHPSGDRVAYNRLQSIFAIDMTGDNEVPVADHPQLIERSPVYSPDGRKIAWAANPDIETPERDLIIANADGSNPQLVSLPAQIASVEEIDWASDTIRPRAKITKGPKRKTRDRKAKFRFKSSEAASKFRCKLDSKPFNPCKSGKTYKNLKRGKHTFKVRATDFAGNTGKPAKAAFKVLR